MTFTESVRSCLLTKPFTLSGRASRSEYWWFNLFIIFYGIATYFIIECIGPFGKIFNFLIIGPQFCVAVRRLHDSNLSGWILPSSILLSLIFFFLLLAYQDFKIWGAFLIAVINIIMLYFYCRRGTPGTNKYGKVPCCVAKAGEGNI